MSKWAAKVNFPLAPPVFGFQGHDVRTYRHKIIHPEVGCIAHNGSTNELSPTWKMTEMKYHFVPCYLNPSPLEANLWNWNSRSLALSPSLSTSDKTTFVQIFAGLSRAWLKCITWPLPGILSVGTRGATRVSVIWGLARYVCVRERSSGKYVKHTRLVSWPCPLWSLTCLHFVSCKLRWSTRWRPEILGHAHPEKSCHKSRFFSHACAMASVDSSR